MRRFIYLRVADKDVHLPKLIGAFILVAAVLMFFHAIFSMVDSWNTVKYYNSCIENLSDYSTTQEQRAQFTFCADALYRATSVVVRGSAQLLSSAQFAGAILSPIASVLFWLAILLFGYMLYRSGDLELPIEERIREVPDYPVTPSRGFKKKK